MVKEDQDTFNEAFQEDFDTTIVFIEEMHEMKFLYIKEEHPSLMSDTIAAIKERYCIPEEYLNAKQHIANTIKRVEVLLEKDRHPYRVDINLILKSVMQAHGMVDPDELNFDYYGGEIDRQ